MKTNIIKVLFGLILTLSISGLYAQSPRIKLNQIVKDTVSGSVLISNLADSNMVYSRNFYIGSDTSLVFFGTTIVAGGGGGGSFVTLPQLTDSLALYATKVQLSDSIATVLKQVATDLTLTGDGTGASPLKVDTSVIATVSALRDSLAGIISSVSTDVTLTGDGSVGNPLKVDTTVIATIKALSDSIGLLSFATNQDISDSLATLSFATNQDISDSLATLSFATNQDISDSIQGLATLQDITDTLDLNTRGFLTSEVDGSVTNEGSLTVGAGTASTSVISSNTSGSTDVTLTAGSNITLSESGNNITIAATGGGASYNNISETADTVYISDYLNVDTATLYVDATNNRVGIGTDSPSAKLDVVSGTGKMAFDGTRTVLYDNTSKLNVFIGNSAGSTEAADNNLAIGNVAGRYLKSTARANMFLGGQAAANDSITGDYNSAIGYVALNRLTSGESNTGIGTGALDFLTTGSGNIGIGFIAGRDLTTGSYNIYIGNSAFPNSASVSNEIVIGYNTTGRGSNTISLGNTSMTSIAGQVSFSTYSDARDKKNITDLNDGLNLIEKLRPVKFVWNTRDGGKVDVNDIGFIAQEVDGVQYQGSDVDYLNIVQYNSASDDWTITYDKFTPIIVKAIQEQQEIIQTQQTEIDNLKTQIQLILSEIEQIKNN